MAESSSFDEDEQFVFLGRTFEESCHKFDLSPGELPDGILDCPGGSSSFTAIASAVGVAATAVDPAYGRPLATLEAECMTALKATVTQLEGKRDAFVWDLYRDVNTRGRYLRAVAERSLVDGEYLDAALYGSPLTP